MLHWSVATRKRHNYTKWTWYETIALSLDERYRLSTWTVVSRFESESRLTRTKHHRTNSNPRELLPETAKPLIFSTSRKKDQKQSAFPFRWCVCSNWKSMQVKQIRHVSLLRLRHSLSHETLIQSFEVCRLICQYSETVVEDAQNITDSGL